MGEFNYEKEFKNWKWNIPKMYNIGADVVDKHADSNNRNKVALYWENSEGISKKFTFWDMKNLTNKFGNALKKLGFKKADRFLVRLPNIPEFHISFLGGVKIGAIPIPSSVIFRSNDIEYQINDSGSIGIITTSQHVKKVNEIKKNCLNLKHIIITDEAYGDELDYNELMKESSRNLQTEPTNSNDMAFFSYTSGTSETPKGVVHSHRWVPGNDSSIMYWQHGKNEDLLAHTGDLNWIYPLGNGFLYPWRWGFSTFIYEGIFDPERWLELIEKYKITNLASVPTAYSRFITIKDASKRYDLSSLRHCISTGEPLNPDIINKWKQQFNFDIYDGIGMTEIMVFLSNLVGMNIKPGSCGRPQPGKICALVDQKGDPVPKGKPGILAVKRTDPGLFLKYWKKPDITNKSFKKGWFLTDVILYQDDDDYFWFTGSDTLIENTQGHTKVLTDRYKFSQKLEFVDELPKTQNDKIKR